jgi:hypothetical protein
MTTCKASNATYSFSLTKRARLSLFLTAICGILFLASVNAYSAPAHSCQNLFEPIETTGRDFLGAEAKQVGLKIETFEEAFRFDSRQPSLIRKAQGFLPNPNKPEGNLKDHVKSGSIGTDQFVSLTLEANNTALFLQDVFLAEAGRSHKFPDLKSEQRYLELFKPEYLAALEAETVTINAKLSELLARPYDRVWFMKYKDANFAALTAEEKVNFNRMEDRLHHIERELYTRTKGVLPPEVLEFIQYRVAWLRGVATSSIGIEREKEIVTTGVPTENITHYRKLYLIFYGGDFKPPQPSDPYYSSMYQTALAMAGNPPDVVLGSWHSF